MEATSNNTIPTCTMTLSFDPEIKKGKLSTLIGFDELDELIRGDDEKPSGWYIDLKNKIEELGNRQDGWKGPGSLAPDADAVRYAQAMLTKIAAAKIARKPMVGLDFEGTFSFSWFDNSVSADLTVYNDGTYSFFISIENGDSASADENFVDQPFNPRLLKLLRS